jgi:hypothetical protein
MNVGLNRERHLGLEIVRTKLVSLHQDSLKKSSDENRELNALAGVKPITDEETAKRLSVPISVATSFGISSRIHSRLIEQHDSLASNPTIRETASLTVGSDFEPREEVRMVFGRFPTIYRQAVVKGNQLGFNNVLDALSLDSVPLTEIFDSLESSAQKYVQEVRANMFGRMHLFPTNTVGVFLGMTYVESRPYFRVFYQEQLNVQKSLEN